MFMRKIVAFAMALILLFSICACDGLQFPGGDDAGTKYKLTVIDFWGYLMKPLKEYYAAGEEVRVTLQFLSGPSVGIELNGEYIGEIAEIEQENGFPVITFTMPAKDSVLYTTQNGDIGFKPTFSRAGSGMDPQIPKNALNSDRLNGSNPYNLPVYKFDTLAELEKFKSDFGGENGFDCGCDEVPSFNEVTKYYSEDYFERYTLLLVCIEARSGSYRFGFKDVIFEDGSLSIRVEQTNDPESCDDDMAAWFITILVRDSMIEGYTEFNAVFVPAG